MSPHVGIGKNLDHVVAFIVAIIACCNLVDFSKKNRRSKSVFVKNVKKKKTSFEGKKSCAVIFLRGHILIEKHEKFS